jgi:nicotinamide riboside transporter PnuC
MYLYFAIKQEPKAWLFGIAASISSFFLFYLLNLNGSAGLNIVYALQGLFGFLQWQFIKKYAAPAFKLKTKEHLFLIGFILIIFLISLLALKSYKLNNIAKLDVLLALLCVLTTFLEIKKETACWYYWIVLNSLYTVLYSYQGLYGYALMMFGFGVFSIWALKEWTSKKSIAPNLLTE